MSPPLFDLAALFEDVDNKRQVSGLSWSALSALVGVSASTIRRYRVADDAEADGVLALIQWLDINPENYITDGSVAGERLPDPSRGHVRVDMELIAEAEGDHRGADGRSRTTIQRLTKVAQHSLQPVSSLTRISDI